VGARDRGAPVVEMAVVCSVVCVRHLVAEEIVAALVAVAAELAAKT